MKKDINDIQAFSLTELRAKRNSGRSETQATATAMSVDDAFWENAEGVMPNTLPKVHVDIRLDLDILEWFKSDEKTWQIHINSVLRSYYEYDSNYPS